MAKWMTYIGGKYTEATFIEEAGKQGISRRLSAQQAQAMNYGDVVACLHWIGGQHGHSTVFAEFTVSRLLLPEDISAKLTEQLYEEGCIVETQGGGGAIDRKCGSYIEGCTYYVSGNVDIPELVSRANAIFADMGQKPWYMVGGWLGKVYCPPDTTTTPFFRGFRQATGVARINSADKHQVDNCNIVEVQDYTRG